jgi:hypothetical protein
LIKLKNDINRKSSPSYISKYQSKTEILVFKHPIAGIQIVKGTVETNEELEEAALLFMKNRGFLLHIHSFGFTMKTEETIDNAHQQASDSTFQKYF